MPQVLLIRVQTNESRDVYGRFAVRHPYSDIVPIEPTQYSCDPILASSPVYSFLHLFSSFRLDKLAMLAFSALPCLDSVLLSGTPNQYGPATDFASG